MTDIVTSILAIKADAQVSVVGEDANNITWHDGNPTNITKEQILADTTKWDEYVVKYNKVRTDNPKS